MNASESSPTSALWPLSDRGRAVLSGVLGEHGIDYLLVLDGRGFVLSCGGRRAVQDGPDLTGDPSPDA